MRRGDIVVASAKGDYGKPRPAVIVQTDAFPETHESVVLCQMTSVLIDAPTIRVSVEPSDINGLRARCQIMVDKPITVRRNRIGAVVGTLSDEDVTRLNIALTFVMGLGSVRPLTSSS